MSLQSLFFVFGFLPLFLLAYYCIKDNLKNLLIVAGSCAFYAFCSRKALVYLIIIFLMTYVFSLIIDFIQSKKQHNNIIGKSVFGIILSLSLIAGNATAPCHGRSPHIAPLRLQADNLGRG